MIVTYLRSSSYGTHSMCPMMWYLEYQLGWKGPSGKAAEKGTIAHKVLEILAFVKLNQQNGIDKFEDEIVGEVDIFDYDVDELTRLCIEYYTSFSVHEWAEKDYRECYRSVTRALEYNDGEFDPRNAHILQPEQGFDITIEKPWAMYDYELPNGERMEGFLSIKGTMDQISLVDKDTIRILDWKGLPTDTLIPTPMGWSTMGGLKVGDTVFDKDGNHTKVVGKSAKSYKPCYRIDFDDTTSAVCDNEHLWLLDNDEVVPITELQVGNKIDICKSIINEDKDLPIDPYLLGIWLGDGRNRSMEISGVDDFVFEEIQRRGYSIGKDLEKRSETLRTHTILETNKYLRNLNLFNNKHIPDIYLRSSISQRLDLLRGLMDSDGNANTQRKQAVFTTTNKTLSDDVKKLLITLGQRPNQSKVTRSTNFKDNVTVFPIAFRPININPFLLPRKAKQIKNDWGPGFSNKRRVVSIEKLDIEKETQCIMVDSPSNTYLCTENMIPTHNTGGCKNWATGEKYDYKTLQDNHQLLMYYYAVKHLYPDIKNVEIVIYYINNAGPFYLCFTEEDLPRVERMLEKKFKEIKETEVPALKKDFKCRTFCHQGKTTFEGTEILPIVEKRNGQVTPKGQYMTKCEQTKFCLEHRTPELVAKHMTRPGHQIDKYDAPGEV